MLVPLVTKILLSLNSPSQSLDSEPPLTLAICLSPDPDPEPEVPEACDDHQDPAHELPCKSPFLISCENRTNNIRNVGIDPKIIRNHISVKTHIFNFAMT